MSKARLVAAFFDLDGTLLPGPSVEWRFIGYLLNRDAILSAHLWGRLSRFLKLIFLDPCAASVGNKLYLAGLRENLVPEWENSGAPGSLPFFAEGIDCVAQHLAREHHIVLVSGTLAPLARVIAHQLPGSVEVCATELEVLDGRWTGRLGGDHLRGEAKARAVRALAMKFGWDLEQSYAYGNEMADLPMLRSVGRPVAVNPSVRLARRAREFGWPVCRWSCARAATSGEPSHLLASKEIR
jgi:HAD superfamily hydrolase (TIGR01490 family)